MNPAGWRIRAALLVAALASATAARAVGEDVVRWFAPWVDVDDGDAREIGRGRVVAKVLPGEGNEIGLFFAGAVDATPDVFIDAVRNPEEMWKGPKVPHVGRFSSPPRLSDLGDLRLPDRDVEAIRDCRPGRCAVKLASDEIERLRASDSVQDAFRQVLLDRVNRYLAHGFRSVESFHDHDDPVDPRAVAGELLASSPWLTHRAPDLAARIETIGSNGVPVDSFLYWLETTYTPKPTIQIVHVLIERRDAGPGADSEVLVASRQVYASHYINGALALSVLLPGDGTDGSRRYLTYATRVHVDDIRGFLSSLRRLVVERATRGRGEQAFDELRRRLDAW